METKVLHPKVYVGMTARSTIMDDKMAARRRSAGCLAHPKRQQILPHQECIVSNERDRCLPKNELSETQLKDFRIYFCL